MTVDVIDNKGKKVSSITVNDKVFTGKVNDTLIYETVKMQLAGKRSGTASTKTRGEVRGSNAKPWRQKGSGRARVGTKRNPVWRGGGIAFGPRPRDYSYGMPKKAVKGALKSAVQFKINEGKLKLLETISVSEPKTKLAAEFLKAAELKKALIVTAEVDDNLKLAIRNLRDFKCINVSALNVYDVLRFDELVMTKDAFTKLESVFL
ncbi:MAG: 50S ribosomal protein L4 [Deltaproteobacteria bacterium]|nr:50S ribosomal protein L4 [Deltaproteobacteria bacterium]